MTYIIATGMRHKKNTKRIFYYIEIHDGSVSADGDYFHSIFRAHLGSIVRSVRNIHTWFLRNLMKSSIYTGLCVFIDDIIFCLFCCLASLYRRAQINLVDVGNKQRKNGQVL